MDTNKDLANRFTYHPPTEADVPVYEQIRAEAHGFAQFVLDNVPESRERSLAITKIEEAVFWANAARARNHA